MRLLVLLLIVIVPPPVRVTLALAMIKSVELAVEFSVMPPEPVWFELVMVLPPMVSVLLLLKLRISVLPMVRLLMLPGTFNVTTELAVVMLASLLVVGMAPVDQLVPVFQLPEPPNQLSGVMTKGRTPNGCGGRPLPEISRWMAFCPRSLTGCCAARSAGVSA